VVLSQSLLTGEKIEPSDVPSILEKLHIELTEEELEELMKRLPVDGKSVGAPCEGGFYLSALHF